MGLDATAWWKATACAGLTAARYTEADYEAGKPLPFDLGRAHALYEGLLGKAEDMIKGKHHLIMPAGALTTLPFQVLVTKPPASNDPAFTAWLIRDHAITVLPSVASLAALRRTAKQSAATKPMIGFGNALLDGDQRDPRYGAYYKELADMARSEIGCAATPAQRTASLRTVSRSATPVAQPDGVADLADPGYLPGIDLLGGIRDSAGSNHPMVGVHGTPMRRENCDTVITVGSGAIFQPLPLGGNRG